MTWADRLLALKEDPGQHHGNRLSGPSPDAGVSGTSSEAAGGGVSGTSSVAAVDVPCGGSLSGPVGPAAVVAIGAEEVRRSRRGMVRCGGLWVLDRLAWEREATRTGWTLEEMVVSSKTSVGEVVLEVETGPGFNCRRTCQRDVILLKRTARSGVLRCESADWVLRMELRIGSSGFVPG